MSVFFGQYIIGIRFRQCHFYPKNDDFYRRFLGCFVLTVLLVEKGLWKTMEFVYFDYTFLQELSVFLFLGEILTKILLVLKNNLLKTPVRFMKNNDLCSLQNVQKVFCENLLQF